MKYIISKYQYMKYLYVLSLCFVSVVVFSNPVTPNAANGISSATTFISKTQRSKIIADCQQEYIKVSGKVLNAETKRPIAGANVTVRDTNNRTFTDKNGKFELSAKKGDVLIVAVLGMQTQSIIVKDDASFLIMMRFKVEGLNEIIVAGHIPSKEKVFIGANKADIVTHEEEAFANPLVWPEFPGGMEGCRKFIMKNLKYPNIAKRAGIKGRVVVQFVVQRDGIVSCVEILSGVCPELDAEALRVINMMPKWKPGMDRGNPVDMKFTFPIEFRLRTLSPDEWDKADDVYTYDDLYEAYEKHQVFVEPYEMPEFPGSMKECMKFITKNIVYPVCALQNKIEGRVIVNFVVRKDGTISYPHIVRGISPCLDAEALRVVNMMPKWKPAMSGNGPFDMSLSIPVMFRLPKEE